MMAGLVERLPPLLARRLPTRYSIQSGLWKGMKIARMMHLGSLLCLSLLLVTMMYWEDTQTFVYLKEGLVNYYLAFIPPHPDGLGTHQLWKVITQLVTSAVLNQNITHNGTLKGVVSLRQFRLIQYETRSFFPDCDYSRLDKWPLTVPNSTEVPSAWHYFQVRQVAQVNGRWCSYPPEGYNVYLGDQQGYTGVGNMSLIIPEPYNLGIAPQEVLNDCLRMLEDLQQHLWVDNLTMTLLLTLLAAHPGTATPTAITIIFENPIQFGGEDGNPPSRWWSSYAVVAVDLRPNIVVSVLLPVFLLVHIFVMWSENIGLQITDWGEVVRRCITLATVVHMTILALHAIAVYLHFTSSFELYKEVSRYYVSFKMRFNPEKYDDKHNNQGRRANQGSELRGGREGIVPNVKWNPEYKISVRQITLARVLELKARCWQLLSIEVILYLVSFILFKQHYSQTIHISMRTIRSGMYRATAIAAPLLALLVLISYLVYRVRYVRGGEDFHTFAGVLKKAVNAMWGAEEGMYVLKTMMKCLLSGLLVMVTLLFWRICVSPDESRAMRTQRLPLHPL